LAKFGDAAAIRLWGVERSHSPCQSPSSLAFVAAVRFLWDFIFFFCGLYHNLVLGSYLPKVGFILGITWRSGFYLMRSTLAEFCSYGTYRRTHQGLQRTHHLSTAFALLSRLRKHLCLLILAQVIFSKVTDPKQYLVLGAVCAVISKYIGAFGEHAIALQF